MCEPTLYEEVLRKSRKEHRCCECFNPIKKGVKYYDIKGLWDGEFSGYKAHENCHELLKMLSVDSFTGEPLPFHELFDAILNILPDSMISEFRESRVDWTEEVVGVIKAKYEMSLL